MKRNEELHLDLKRFEIIIFSSLGEFVIWKMKGEKLTSEFSRFKKAVNFSKSLTGFSKNHNTQHASLNTTENGKSNLNKGTKIGVIFMDLPKAFDTLGHSLLITKLRVYDFDSLSLEFVKNYLTNRKQM